MKLKDYLCIEHGEKFLIRASSIEEAHQEAMTWGAQVIGEVDKNGKLKNIL